MMLSFKLVDAPAPELDSSIALYLSLLEHRVLHILAAKTAQLTENLAHTLCEYIDSVDGGLLPMQEPVYQDSTSLIAGYLLSCEEASRKRLCGKNWTAATLMDVLRSWRYNCNLCEVYPTELVA